MNRRSFLLAASACVGASGVPVGAKTHADAIPVARQLRWQALELTAFLHFNMNTFTDREWGLGDEDPKLFNPVALDADAIVAELVANGFRGVILTCKHHDGFCLWPTQTTDHSVRSASWRNGLGDVVKEFSDAAKRHNLPFGVYLSPWDRNNAAYGKPEYRDIYRRQLTELLTGYGPIFEVWHDGANGGDGYYGGAREKRTIDKHSYYEWPRTWQMVRSLQPDAVIFSDVGPDIRWVGNEKGVAGDPCWAAYDPVGENGGPAAPGDVREADSVTGTRHGSQWMPAECDVSIRPGWFWHASENGQVKTPPQLMDLYFQSVGRGAGFLLNIPPNRQGRLQQEDVEALRGFAKLRQEAFGNDLARGAKWSLSSKPVGVTIDLPAPTTFRLLRLREDLAHGQRISAVTISAWSDGGWHPVASASSIGSCRLIRLPQAVTTQRLQLRINAEASPKLSEVALFA